MYTAPYIALSRTVRLEMHFVAMWLLSITATLSISGVLSGPDVDKSNFYCMPCQQMEYCASMSKLTNVTDDQCYKIGMRLAQEVRPDKKELVVALKECAFQLPNAIDGYLINGTADTRNPCTITTVNMVGPAYVLYQSGCYGATNPYICERQLAVTGAVTSVATTSTTSASPRLPANLDPAILQALSQLQHVPAIRQTFDNCTESCRSSKSLSAGFDLRPDPCEDIPSKSTTGMELNECYWLPGCRKGCQCGVVGCQGKSLTKPSFLSDCNRKELCKCITVKSLHNNTNSPTVNTTASTVAPSCGTASLTVTTASRAPQLNPPPQDSEWKNVSGRLFMLTKQEEDFCATETTCKNYGGRLSNGSLSDADMMKLILSLELANQMPKALWINRGHNSCGMNKTESILISKNTKILFINTTASVKFAGLCEKDPSNNDNTTSTTMTLSYNTAVTTLPQIAVTHVTFAKTSSHILALTTSSRFSDVSTSIPRVASTTIPPQTQAISFTSSQILALTTSSRLSDVSTSILHVASTTIPPQIPAISTTSHTAALTASSYVAATSASVEVSDVTPLSYMTAAIKPTPSLTVQSQVAATHTAAQSSVAMTTPTPMTTSPTTAPQAPDGWIHDNQREFYVNRNESNFTVASETCRARLNASLVFFTNALQYLDLSESLRLTPGQFWVGVALNTSHPECLQLKVGQDHGAMLSKADCRDMSASICSRVANVSHVLNNPAFARLIEDMTIDSATTQKSKRKLVSVYEERKSAQAVGGIGVAVFVTVFALIVLLDLNRVKDACRHNNAEKVKVIRVRKASERGRLVSSDSSC